MFRAQFTSKICYIVQVFNYFLRQSNENIEFTTAEFMNIALWKQEHENIKGAQSNTFPKDKIIEANVS